MSEKLWRVDSELLGGMKGKRFKATSKGGVRVGMLMWGVRLIGIIE